MKSYPGGKRAHGSYQNIINEIPEVERVIILFAGNCPVGKYFAGKIPTTIIERSTEVINEYWISKMSMAMVEVINCDSCTWLRSHLHLLGPETFIYADPPYLGSVRRSNQPIYEFEMMREKEHSQLSELLLSTTAYVGISGYYSSLYEKLFEGWRLKTWNARTRQGNATEHLWMNYPKPEKLQTYEFLGNDKTDRQRVKRKIDRWVSKLSALDPQERNAIMSALEGRFK